MSPWASLFWSVQKGDRGKRGDSDFQHWNMHVVHDFKGIREIKESQTQNSKPILYCIKIVVTK